MASNWLATLLSHGLAKLKFLYRIFNFTAIISNYIDIEISDT